MAIWTHAPRADAPMRAHLRCHVLSSVIHIHMIECSEGRLLTTRITCRRMRWQPVPANALQLQPCPAIKQLPSYCRAITLYVLQSLVSSRQASIESVGVDEKQTKHEACGVCELCRPTWSTEWDTAPALVAGLAMTSPPLPRLPFLRASKWYRLWWGWPVATRTSSSDSDACATSIRHCLESPGTRRTYPVDTSAALNCVKQIILLITAWATNGSNKNHW